MNNTLTSPESVGTVTTKSSTKFEPSRAEVDPLLAERLATSRGNIEAFGQHYDYDVTYITELMERSPGAFFAFEAAMGMGRFRGVAPLDLLTIVKLTASRNEDCGPCTYLGVKMAREAGVPEQVIQGALKGGKGLTDLQREVYDYAHSVATNEAFDYDLFARLEQQLGQEVMGELALGIVAARMYPTLKRGLGHATSCALIPALND